MNRAATPLALAALALATLAPAPADAATREPHDRILIASDADLTFAGASTGCACVRSGSGTPADPFVISGWSIHAPTGTAVYVKRTTASFVLEDNDLTSPGGAQIGVYLLQLEGRATLRGNLVSGFLDGVKAVDSDVTLERNVMSRNSEHGVIAWRSDLVLRGNTFLENGRAALPGKTPDPTGALFLNEGVTATLDGDRFERNSFSAIDVKLAPRVDVSNVTIVGASTESGYGIAASGTRFTLQDSLITGTHVAIALDFTDPDPPGNSFTGVRNRIVENGQIHTVYPNSTWPGRTPFGAVAILLGQYFRLQDKQFEFHHNVVMDNQVWQILTLNQQLANDDAADWALFDASHNYWGSANPAPGSTSVGNVNIFPYYTDPGMTTLGPVTFGE